MKRSFLAIFLLLIAYCVCFADSAGVDFHGVDVGFAPGEWHRVDIYGNVSSTLWQFYVDGKLYREETGFSVTQFFAAYFPNYGIEYTEGQELD